MTLANASSLPSRNASSTLVWRSGGGSISLSFCRSLRSRVCASRKRALSRNRYRCYPIAFLALRKQFWVWTVPLPFVVWFATSTLVVFRVRILARHGAVSWIT